MWLFAVKYLHLFFFCPKSFGKEEESWFIFKFPWSLPGSHPEIISSIFAFCGMWGFAKLKNKTFIPLNTNDAPLFKYNINFEWLFSLLSNPEFASYMKALPKYTPFSATKYSFYPVAWHLLTPNSLCMCGSKPNRKIRGPSGWSQQQSSPLPFPTWEEMESQGVLRDLQILWRPAK